MIKMVLSSMQCLQTGRADAAAGSRLEPPPPNSKNSKFALARKEEGVISRKEVSRKTPVGLCSRTYCNSYFRNLVDRMKWIIR